jgi:hypothetical protein
VNPGDLSKPINEESIKVTMDDFISALNEVKPAFGAAINTLEMCRFIFPDCFQTNGLQTDFVSNRQKRFFCLWHSPLSWGDVM